MMAVSQGPCTAYRPSKPRPPHGWLNDMLILDRVFASLGLSSTSLARQSLHIAQCLLKRDAKTTAWHTHTHTHILHATKQPSLLWLPCNCTYNYATRSRISYAYSITKWSTTLHANIDRVSMTVTSTLVHIGKLEHACQCHKLTVQQLQHKTGQAFLNNTHVTKIVQVSVCLSVCAFKCVAKQFNKPTARMDDQMAGSAKSSRTVDSAL